MRTLSRLYPIDDAQNIVRIVNLGVFLVVYLSMTIRDKRHIQLTPGHINRRSTFNIFNVGFTSGLIYKLSYRCFFRFPEEGTYTCWRNVVISFHFFTV